MKIPFNFNQTEKIIITAGSAYLDIDAYACMVAMAELLSLQGMDAVAYSSASLNYSVCSSIVEEGQVLRKLPTETDEEAATYIIVDVSDPEFLKSSVPLERVVRVYDHHVGFEDYWYKRIGDGAHIEFIGAAATLIYREWKNAGLQNKMSRSTALLLIAAILDNTLNLTSSNTTEEDKEVLRELCVYANADDQWRASYFSQVQKNIEGDLKSALFGDLKTVRDNKILPPRVAQLCVWNAESIISKLPEIRLWFESDNGPWMINIIDLSQNCSFFVCYDTNCQEKIGNLFKVSFSAGVARTQKAYLRKQIIKKTLSIT